MTLPRSFSLPHGLSTTQPSSRPDLQGIEQEAVEELLQANSMYTFFCYHRLSITDALLASLLSTGEGSDVVILCANTTFRAHRAIICRRSEFFMTACFRQSHVSSLLLSPSKAHAAQSQPLHTIDIRDEDHELVKRSLHYLYKLSYLYDSEEKQHVRDTDPILHARMYAISVRLRIISLCRAAVYKLSKWLELHSLPDARPFTPLFSTSAYPLDQSPVTPLVQRDLNGKKLTERDLEILPEVLKIFWTYTSEEAKDMKDTLLQYVFANVEILSPLPSFNVVLNTGLGFATEWLQYQQQHT